MGSARKLRELLTRHEKLAEQQPDGPAVVYRCEPYSGISLTWEGLCARAERMREILLAGGVRPREVTALVLHDCPDLIPALLALWRLESPPVLLDPKWGDGLRGGILAHSTPSCLIEIDPDVTVTPTGNRDGCEAPEDAVFIGYTSGSTGDPKAIVFTHERLHDGTLGNAAASVRLHGSPPRRIARSMRMSGSGVINLHHTWGAVLGACVVVLPELTVDTARDYWERIEAHQIDQTFLVPQLVDLVSRFAADRPARAPGPVCFTGSAPLSPRVQERFQRRFGLPLLNAYGLSETSSAAFFGHLGADGLATISIGVPERCAARLRDASGRIVTGAGEGEIELSGAQVFGGYYRNPRATGQTLVEGWLRTGDMARRDADGLYYLIGRGKDVVMKGSYAIYLNEVEEVAQSHPAVLEAAAVPLRLADSAEDVGCLVRLVDGAETRAGQLASWLRSELGAQRAPCRVVITEDPLPRGGQDKLERPAVAARWDALPKVPRTLRRAWDGTEPGQS